VRPFSSSAPGLASRADRVHGDAASKSVEVTKLTAVTAEAHIALWRVLLGLDLMDTITVDTHAGQHLHGRSPRISIRDRKSFALQ